MSDAVLVVKDVDLGYNREGNVFAVLHLCTNAKCIGSTVGYYVRGGRTDEEWDCKFHQPEYEAYSAPEELPKRPRTILQDANDSRNSPVACTAAASRAVEAMLAEKGYRERKKTLYQRIEDAVKAGDLPKAMGDWAHEVREIGRDTHTDEKPPPLPTDKDAEQALIFANTLADYLFVLPDRISKAQPKKK